MTSPTSGNSFPPSLAHTISGLSSASSDSMPTKEEVSDPLSAFFATSGYSPPERAHLVPMRAVVTSANGYLSKIGMNWHGLDTLGKVKLAFLLLRQQDERIYAEFLSAAPSGSAEDATKKTASILWKVCTDESDPHFSKVEAFIRKGGDLPESNASFSLSALVEKFPDYPFDGEQAKAITLFYVPSENGGRSIEPMVRLQDDKSTICYLVSAVAAIYYIQCIKHGGGFLNDETKRGLALNVNRYMRNNFSDDEIFTNIFRREGGWPCEMIDRILQPFNAGKKVSRTQDFEPYLDSEGDENMLFLFLKKNLSKYGALIIENVPVFDELLEDNGALEFSGDWKSREDKRDDLPTHALLVVGARLTGDPNSMGGLALLLQNSWQSKPFLVFGYDLLKSMGVTEFTVVKDNLNFFIPGNCSLDGELSNNSFMSGTSPHGQHDHDSLFTWSDSDLHTPMSSIVAENDGAYRPVTDPAYRPVTDAYYWREVKHTDKNPFD